MNSRTSKYILKGKSLNSVKIVLPPRANSDMDHKISNTEKHRGNSKFQILQLWCPAVRFFAKVETLAKGPVFSLACGVCAAAQQHYY